MTWEILLGIAAVVLVIAAAMLTRRSNTVRRDSFTDAATGEFHQRPDSYEKTRRELERQLLP